MLTITWQEESRRIMRVVETTLSWHRTQVREVLHDLNNAMTQHPTDQASTDWILKHYLPKLEKHHD